MKKPRRAFVGRENPVQTFEIKPAYVSVVRQLLLLVDTQTRKWITMQDKGLSKLVDCIHDKNSRILQIRVYSYDTRSTVAVVLATMYGSQLQIAVRYYRTSKIHSNYITMYDVITTVMVMKGCGTAAETTEVPMVPMSPELLQLLKQSLKTSMTTHSRMQALSSIIVESASALRQEWDCYRAGPVYFIVDQPVIPW
jgi:hypothetical protein